MVSNPSLYTLHLHKAKIAGNHYDLRLKKGNDVFSFALPKSQIPNEQNIFLAIKTHINENDISILKFSGIISDGEYGAGKIEILERGKMIIHSWDNSNKKIIFNIPKQFTDQIIEGTYYLVETSKPNQYIFGKLKKSI